MDPLVRELLLWELEMGGYGLPAASSAAPNVQRSTAASDTGLEPARGIAAAQMTSFQAAPRRTLSLVEAEAAVPACTRCSLHAHRNHTAFARGSLQSPLVFVGEGPGQHEDEQGIPFVGPAGQLLDKMIVAMGYRPDDVYICNVVKCRPPENRNPLPNEVDACADYLEAQLVSINPRCIVALGKVAVHALLGEKTGAWRGQWGAWRGIPVMPTYHPAYLLRSPEMKRPVWEDLQAVMVKLKA